MLASMEVCLGFASGMGLVVCFGRVKDDIIERYAARVLGLGEYRVQARRA